jgi:hypothetical protein
MRSGHLMYLRFRRSDRSETVDVSLAENRGVTEGNRLPDPHDRFTILFPGQAHLRPNQMIRPFSARDGLFASCQDASLTELF